MIKNSIILILVILIGIVGYMYIGKSFIGDNQGEQQVQTPVQQPATSTPVVPEAPKTVGQEQIGSSVGGLPIIAHWYGTGTDEIIFIGGIHGGYEWNTSLVAYELMDMLTAQPQLIPSNIKVTVIPVLNPDGLSKVVGKADRFSKTEVSSSQDIVVSGRFNGNNVDLNRNFDCDWKSEGVWQNKKVSGGSSAFSEPESQAIKAYVESRSPKAIVTWYSAAGGVFASNCHNDKVLTETTDIVKLFAKASGYPAYQNFNFYEITGDMVNWFAKKNIPAFSVLLTNHEDTEWTKNEAGIKALLNHYNTTAAQADSTNSATATPAVVNPTTPTAQ